MSFRATQRQNPSAGELAIRCRLQTMSVHLLYDRVILFYPSHFVARFKDAVTQGMINEAEAFCLPDALFETGYDLGVKALRFEWDGPAHLKSGVMNRDDIKDKLCAEYGIESFHFSFKPSGKRGISERRLREICRAVKTAVTK